MAEELDPGRTAHVSVRHRQVSLTRCGQYQGDTAGPAAVGSRWLEVLLQQVLLCPAGFAASFGAWPERLAGPGDQLAAVYESGNSMVADLAASPPAASGESAARRCGPYVGGASSELWPPGICRG